MHIKQLFQGLHKYFTNLFLLNEGTANKLFFIISIFVQYTNKINQDNITISVFLLHIIYNLYYVYKEGYCMAIISLN